MRALGVGEAGGDRLGLGVVHAAVALFQRREGRQDKARSKPPGKPDQRTGAPIRPPRRRCHAQPVELLFPELGMRLLDRGKTAVDLGEMRVLLGGGQRAVERGAVDLSLQV